MTTTTIVEMTLEGNAFRLENEMVSGEDNVTQEICLPIHFSIGGVTEPKTASDLVEHRLPLVSLKRKKPFGFELLRREVGKDISVQAHKAVFLLSEVKVRPGQEDRQGVRILVVECRSHTCPDYVKYCFCLFAFRPVPVLERVIVVSAHDDAPICGVEDYPSHSY